MLLEQRLTKENMEKENKTIQFPKEDNWIDDLIRLVEEEAELIMGVKTHEHASGECKMNEILKLVGGALEDERERTLKVVIGEIEGMCVLEREAFSPVNSTLYERTVTDYIDGDALKNKLQQPINKD